MEKSTPTVEVAVALLKKNGLRLIQGDPAFNAKIQALIAKGYNPSLDTYWYLQWPVSDEELARANEILVQSGLGVALNVGSPHSAAQLEDSLESNVTALLTEAGETFGVALNPGFGNGIYRWVELLVGGQVIGHRMDFLDP